MNLHAQTKNLVDYESGNILRQATEAEITESVMAMSDPEDDYGIIIVDNRLCYISDIMPNDEPNLRTS
jgi:hypothetical protein